MLLLEEFMASSTETTCQKCGGRAHKNADDGVTYCDEEKCGEKTVEDKNYRPPERRGG
jgi:ribosomal protein L37AE/L43A